MFCGVIMVVLLLGPVFEQSVASNTNLARVRKIIDDGFCEFVKDDSGHLAGRIIIVHISLLKSKIHRAMVTGANVNYEGSITISADLADEAGLEEYERILAGNMTSGERFETYVVYGARGRGLIELNGATAHRGKPGDILTIMSFGWYDVEEAASHQPNVILLDADNSVIRQSAPV